MLRANKMLSDKGLICNQPLEKYDEKRKGKNMRGWERKQQG